METIGNESKAKRFGKVAIDIISFVTLAVIIITILGIPFSAVLQKLGKEGADKMFYFVLSETLMLIGIFLSAWIVWHFRGVSLTGLGRSLAIRKKDLLSGISLAIVLYAVGFGVSLLAGAIEIAGVVFNPSSLLISFVFFLLVAITEELFGTWGVIMMAIIVLFACLTTAIGLTSGFAGTLENLTNGKCKYKTIVIVMSVFSFVVSNAGIEKIISVAAPMLSVIFPCFITMSVLMFFGKYIKNDNVIRVATLFAFVISLSEVLAGFGLPLTYTQYLPLHEYSLGWILPAVIGGIIGKFIPCKQSEA